MPTAEKTEAVDRLARKMAEAEAIYLADFHGIDVASVTRLRRSLRGAGIEYEVVKNRLARRAAEDAGLKGLDPYLEGPTAMAFAHDDPVAPAKILQEFIDDGGKLAIKTGLVDGQVLTAEAIARLARLPSREELIAQLVGSAQSPLYGLVAALNGLLRSLVAALTAIADQRTEGEVGAGGSEA